MFINSNIVLANLSLQSSALEIIKIINLMLKIKTDINTDIEITHKTIEIMINSKSN